MKPAFALLAWVLSAAVCQAQWQSSPSPGIPRRADGQTGADRPEAGYYRGNLTECLSRIRS